MKFSVNPEKELSIFSKEEFRQALEEFIDMFDDLSSFSISFTTKVQEELFTEDLLNEQ